MARFSSRLCVLFLLCAFIPCAVLPSPAVAEPSPAVVAAFNAYCKGVEARLDQQHHAAAGFLAPLPAGQQGDASLRRGEFIIEKLSPAANSQPAQAMLHHWRGTAFAPGARAADFERLMRAFNRYPQIYAPQVAQARVLAQQGDHLQTKIRVRQKHVITVVLDTTYDINFGRLDPQRGFSASRSTQVAEIEAAGTANEHELGSRQEHGFLWRINTYWSYEERDGGVYMQVESVSLTRSVPNGLGWAIQPFVESIPRESLEFTLRATCNGLKR